MEQRITQSSFTEKVCYGYATKLESKASEKSVIFQREMVPGL